MSYSYSEAEVGVSHPDTEMGSYCEALILPWFKSGQLLWPVRHQEELRLPAEDGDSAVRSHPRP